MYQPYAEQEGLLDDWPLQTDTSGNEPTSRVLEHCLELAGCNGVGVTCFSHQAGLFLVAS
jgi:hypothetical protein